VLLHHPNVAAPGGSINFLWMMAANREREDRQYDVVNVAAGIRRRAVGPRQRAMIAYFPDSAV
jgi:5-deoxy-glucuronate isomerase